MVTFSANSASSMRKFAKNALNMSGHTNTTSNTSGSAASTTSTNASSTSPATSSSSTNNDSEFTNNSPLNISDPHLATATAADYPRPVLSSFAGPAPTGTNPRRFLNEPVSSSGGIYSNGSSKSTAASDILEPRFLKKLCDDIETSLNVDSECVDDYSSNDFSGDYSFDNELIRSPAKAYRLKPNPPVKGTNLNELRQNFELNLKHALPAGAKKALNTKAPNEPVPKSHLGVLVWPQPPSPQAIVHFKHPDIFQMFFSSCCC